MTASPTTPGPGVPLPSLPHWDELPEDIPAAIRTVKGAIRGRIEASGRTVEEVFGVIEAVIAERVEEINADAARGETSWTVLDYDSIAAGEVTAEDFAHLGRSGCVVVRGHFTHEQARQWDADMVTYVESNKFLAAYKGPGDNFFGTNPEIYPIYWSSAQMEARQSERMAVVQSFLNRRWKSESNSEQWFDPDHHAIYPDRIRRRPPGVSSEGLYAHIDTGKLDLWLNETYQRAFRHVFDGSVEMFDPWDATHRTVGSQYESSTMCSAFRTFQGWVALSDMANDQGVLRSVPIPEASAYLLLRPLLDDVLVDDMCGVAANRAFPINDEWHPLLMQGFSSIPDVCAGDSVWWHCDLVHGVAPVENQVGWGNVMYIPAAPWCERNANYAPIVKDAFLTGSSPSDFPEEHYERPWPNRFTVSQLNEAGRRGFGL